MIWYKDDMRGLENPNWIHKIRLLALATLLVCGQFALAQHEADLEQHVSDGHCEWCTAAHSLHAALGSQMPPPVTTILRHVYAAHATDSADLSFTAAYFGRAPPVSFRN